MFIAFAQEDINSVGILVSSWLDNRGSSVQHEFQKMPGSWSSPVPRGPRGVKPLRLVKAAWRRRGRGAVAPPRLVGWLGSVRIISLSPKANRIVTHFHRNLPFWGLVGVGVLVGIGGNWWGITRVLVGIGGTLQETTIVFL